MSTQEKKSGNDLIKASYNFLMAMGQIAKINWYGIKQIRRFRADLLLIYLPIGLLIFSASYKFKHLIIAHKIFPSFFTYGVVNFLAKLGATTNAILVTLGYFFVLLIAFGIREFAMKKKYQNFVDHFKFKNAFNSTPKVVQINHISNGQVKIKVRTDGVSIEDFRNKKGILESSSGASVESIENCKDRRFIEIHLAKNGLPQKCFYKNLSDKLDKDYSFVVGESMDGVITQSIRELPHLLIAGTTGGGKSVFFKQTLMGLIESSPHMQMYLLDLKKGVEFAKYEEYPHIRVAKNIQESLVFLRAVKSEMDRRFQILVQSKQEEIDPKRDKLDVIIVAVDEASILYTLGSKQDSNYHATLEARKITDEIAKLGRAAGIHLILATQRVTVKTIDGSIQENVTGKICFRMNTFQGSNLVLGNKKALDLPDIPGRAIWSRGNYTSEVQAPFIDKQELLENTESIKAEFMTEKRKNFQKLLVEKGAKTLGETSLTETDE